MEISRRTFLVASGGSDRCAALRGPFVGGTSSDVDGGPDHRSHQDKRRRCLANGDRRQNHCRRGQHGREGHRDDDDGDARGGGEGGSRGEELPDHARARRSTSHLDTTDTLQQDATYLHKAEFLRSHDMVVFRFHDHWHAHRPDGIATGMARELGWDKKADPAESKTVRTRRVPLAQLAKDMQTRLGIHTMRVIGDPKLVVRRVQANWGYASPAPGMPNFSRPDVDALVIGEAREWELVEYAQDSIKSGQKKALIVLRPCRVGAGGHEMLPCRVAGRASFLRSRSISFRRRSLLGARPSGRLTSGGRK